MSNELTYPQRPDEYLVGDYQFCESGYRWIFGLPAEGQISSAQCGAYPFRKGTGTASPKCIRGEDWAYLASWCQDRQGLVSWRVFDYPQIGNVIYKGPRREQLENMYGNLSSLCCFWGQDYQLEEQEVQYSTYDSVFAGGLVHSYALVSQPIPPTGDVPLTEQRIADYFKDIKNLKCTVADGGFIYTGLREIYSWGKYYDASWLDYEEERPLSDLYLNASYYINDETQRPIGIDAQFYGVMLAWGGTDQTSWSKYALVQLGDKVHITQNLSASNQFMCPVSFGGKEVASKVADIVGKEINPSPTKEEWVARFNCQIEGIYVAVWPTYLQPT